MAKAIKVYSGGVHALTDAAVREDGAVFRRWQNRTPWGYRWGAWTRDGSIDPANLPPTLEAGFSTLHPSAKKVRFPNA